MTRVAICALLLAGCFDYAVTRPDGAAVPPIIVAPDGDVADPSPDLGRFADLGGAGADEGAAPALDMAGAPASDLAPPIDLAPPSDLTPPCTIVHANGIGGSWTDCVALGTHTQAQAMKACQATPGATCSVGFCGGTTYGIINGAYPYGVWYYAGQIGQVGYVAAMTQNCGAAGTGQWN